MSLTVLPILSSRDVIVTVSVADVFLIVTSKVNTPPGSGLELGDGVFVTWIVESTLVSVTTASWLPLTALSSSS